MRLNLAWCGFCSSNLARAKFKERFEKDHSRLRNCIKFAPYTNNIQGHQDCVVLAHRRTI